VVSIATKRGLSENMTCASEFQEHVLISQYEFNLKSVLKYGLTREKTGPRRNNRKTQGSGPVKSGSGPIDLDQGETWSMDQSR
jgi:hypothetical protein